LTPIVNYKYKPGEQIAPKQYKQRLGLSGSMSDIKGPEFFEDVLK